MSDKSESDQSKCNRNTRTTRNDAPIRLSDDHDRDDDGRNQYDHDEHGIFGGGGGGGGNGSGTMDYNHLDLSFDDIAEPDGTSSLLGIDASCSNSASAAAPAASKRNDSKPYYYYDDDDSVDCGKLKKKQQEDGGSYDDEDEGYILGTLIVRVVAARNLEAVETSGMIGSKFFFLAGGGNSSQSKGTSNPYASVRFGNTTQRTSQLFGTVDPIWPRGEAMYMDIAHPDLTNATTSAVVSPASDMGSVKADAGAMKSPADLSSTNQISVEKPNIASVGSTKSSLKRVDEPILTVAIFHASNEAQDRLNIYPKKKGKGSGDSDDVFLGMASLNLRELLTGKQRVVDEWLPLSGGGKGGGGSRDHSRDNSPARGYGRSNSRTSDKNSSNDAASVRIVCEYEASDPAPRVGDKVRFTYFNRPEDLYPAHPYQIYTVEEDCRHPDEQVVISCTSPEGWVSTLLVHRYMLFCTERHINSMDMYQEEMVSLAQRLSNSPIIDLFQQNLQRLPEDGLITVGLGALQGGASILTRWLEGGLGTAVEDIAFATNWDGRFNPNAASQLSNMSLDEEENDISSNPAATTATTASAVDHDYSSDAQTPAYKEPDEVLPNMPACPITQEPMRDPVVAADGHSYERSAIVRWLQTSDKSPLTGQILPHKNVVPNYMLLSSIRDSASFPSSVSAAPPATNNMKAPPPSSPSSPPSTHAQTVVVETVSEGDDTNHDNDDMDGQTTEIQID